MSRQYDPYENVVAVMEEAMNIGGIDKRHSNSPAFIRQYLKSNTIQNDIFKYFVLTMYIYSSSDLK